MFNQLESLHFVLYRICTEFRPSADPSNDPQSGLKERLFLGSKLAKTVRTTKYLAHNYLDLFSVQTRCRVRGTIYIGTVHPAPWHEMPLLTDEITACEK